MIRSSGLLIFHRDLMISRCATLCIMLGEARCPEHNMLLVSDATSLPSLSSRLLELTHNHSTSQLCLR